MTSTLSRVLEAIELRSPVHAKKLRSSLSEIDESFETEMTILVDRYLGILEPEGKGLDFLIDCYLRSLDDIFAERVEFLRSGAYRYTSFGEVNARVYANPEVMAYHMHGLFLSQFLWHQHYKMYRYFSNIARTVAPGVRRYLEVGGGHGLYLRAFSGFMHPGAEIDVIDISPTSLRICREMAAGTAAHFILGDIQTMERPDPAYDFITMGEVLEHVEDPVSLLRKLGDLSAPDARIFITTPTNAPSIDHIYLFRNVDEIRTVISASGLEIVEDLAVVTEERKNPAKSAGVKIATFYGALLAPARR